MARVNGFVAFIAAIFEMIEALAWKIAEYFPIARWGIVLGRRRYGAHRHWNYAFVVLGFMRVKHDDSHNSPVAWKIIILRLMGNRGSNLHNQRVWISTRKIGNNKTQGNRIYN